MAKLKNLISNGIDTRPPGVQSKNAQGVEYTQRFLYNNFDM